MSQTGARFLARRRNMNLNPPEDRQVCTSHYKTGEEWESIPVKDGVRKRPRMLKRKAE